VSSEQLRKLLDDWAVPPPELVGKLPKGGTSLDYLGHAAVTRALIEADPEWTWEPLAFTPEGTPYISFDDKNASMWIRLTVHGVSRLGVGTCELRKFEVEKELIGDALRNSAMRFGIGLSLWAKEEWSEPEPITYSAAQAKGHIVEVLRGSGMDRADAIARAAVLWENHGPSGSEPYTENDLARVFDETTKAAKS
jgi:hypothetical protein